MTVETQTEIDFLRNKCQIQEKELLELRDYKKIMTGAHAKFYTEGFLDGLTIAHRIAREAFESKSKETGSIASGWQQGTNAIVAGIDDAFDKIASGSKQITPQQVAKSEIDHENANRNNAESLASDAGRQVGTPSGSDQRPNGVEESTGSVSPNGEGNVGRGSDTSDGDSNTAIGGIPTEGTN